MDGGALTYGYDGSLPTSATWAGAIAGSVGCGYDNDFRLTSLKVNDADPVTYQYDQDSLLSQAGAMSLGRNAQNGMMTGTTLGGVTDSYVYNELDDRSCLLGSIHGYDCTFFGGGNYGATKGRIG